VPRANFNFYEWARQMGLKHPDSSGIQIAESIQPVMNVGDFTSLVPVHAPPTASFGGESPAVVAEFSQIQVVSLARGGTVIPVLDIFLIGSARWRISATRLAGFTAMNPQVWSNTAPRTIVEVGSDPVAVLNETDFPFAGARDFPRGFWLPPGQTLLLELTGQINVRIDFNVTVEDVPASEGGD